MLFGGETASKNHIPQGRADSESCVLSSVVMLVVVLLQTLKPSHLVLLRLQEMQEVVCAIV